MAARPPLPALTGLRFVAALQVLIFHSYPYGSGLVPGWAEALIGTGYVGVSLFFVLSGFILTYNYEDAVRAGTLRRAAFWRARFARVYPVYLLGIAVALPVFFLASERSAAQVADRVGPNVAASVVLMQAWSPRTACVVNCPGWSISVETLFYLLFPLVAALLVGLRPRGLRRVVGAAWLAALLPPLLYLAAAPDGIATPGPSSAGQWLTLLKFFPPARLAEFVMGMAAGSLFLRRAADARRRPALEWGALLAVAAALAAAPRAPYPLVHNGLLAPLFALLIYRLAAGEGAAARALSGAALGTLGGASYALYILHVPVGTWLQLGYRTAGVTPTAPAAFALAVGTSVALSLLVFRFVEEPARLRLRGRAPRPALRADPLPSPALAAAAAE